MSTQKMGYFEKYHKYFTVFMVFTALRPAANPPIFPAGGKMGVAFQGN
jgi:hypothetical protein